MTADFTGTIFRLPPGLTTGPRWIQAPPEAIEGPLVVGGRTIVPDGLDRPLIVSHPNRFGGDEDLFRLARLSTERGVRIYVHRDPFLLDEEDIPVPLQPLVEWEVSDPGIRQEAGQRMRLAADHLRRTMRQIAGVRFISETQRGGAVAVLLPVPAPEVVTQLQLAGAAVAATGPWDGCLVIKCGWWHTRTQLFALARAIEAILLGRDPEPIPADRYDRIPDDLPRRWLDTIRPPDIEELV